MRLGQTDVAMTNVQEAAAILFISISPRPPNTKTARNLCHQLIAVFKSIRRRILQSDTRLSRLFSLP